MKKQEVIPRKETGPAAIGKGEPVVVRIHPPQLKALDAWIAQQELPFSSRPEAIRRLVEIGLTAKTNLKQPSAALANRAKELAIKAVEGIIDPSVPIEERARQATSADQRARRVTTIAASP